jgi:hypothetical protein
MLDGGPRGSEKTQSDGNCKKRELEAIHQLSKNRYTCIDHAYSMVTKYKQLYF